METKTGKPLYTFPVSFTEQTVLYLFLYEMNEYFIGHYFIFRKQV